MFHQCLRLRRRYAFCTVSLIGLVFVSVTFVNIWSDHFENDTMNSHLKLQLLERMLNTVNRARESIGKPFLELRESNGSKIVNDEKLSEKDLKLPDYSKSPQKCKIPSLDPYHPDVKPFVQTIQGRECDYPKLTEVTDDGILQVRLMIK